MFEEATEPPSFDPAGGLAMQHAMTMHADDPAAASRYVTLSMKAYMRRDIRGRLLPLDEPDVRELAILTATLRGELLTKLRASRLEARGFLLDGNPYTPSPHWWRRVRVDWTASAAEAANVRVYGIVVFPVAAAAPGLVAHVAPLGETAAPPSESAPEPQVQPTPLPEPEPIAADAATPRAYGPHRILEDWYRVRVATWPVGERGSSGAADWTAVRATADLPGATRDAVRALRTKLAPDEWKAGGRPPKPRGGNLTRK